MGRGHLIYTASLLIKYVSCDDVLPGFRESRQESVVFRLYEDSKLRREEDEEEGAQFLVIYSLSWCL